MMNQVKIQVGSHISTGVIKHIDRDYVVVEHEDGSSSCLDPASVIPLPCLTRQEVYALHDAHYLALMATRDFITRLPRLDLSDEQRAQLKAFAKKSLRLVNDDYNRLERVVKPYQEIGWRDLLDSTEVEIERQRQLLTRGVEHWNLVHPEMPIAL